MVQVSASELARNLKKVLDRLEHGGEEIVVLRNNHPIARMLPGNPHRTALEAMADLHRTLAPAAAENWVEDGRLPRSIAEDLGNDPWDS